MRLALAVLLLGSGWATAQIGYTHRSLEALVADADLVVRGSVTKAVRTAEGGQWVWLEITFDVEETLKGPETEELRFALQTLAGDRRWAQFIESGQEQLWFFDKSDRVVPGEDPGKARIRSRHGHKPARSWPRIRLGSEVDDEASYSRPPPPLFTMSFEILEDREQILVAARAAVAAEPKARPAMYTFDIPRDLAGRCGTSGDANSFVVPCDQRLEELAHRLVAAPEELLRRPEDDRLAGDETQRKAYEASLQSSADRLRAEGARALRAFESEENIGRLKALLDHPATVGTHGTEERVFFVRKAAYEVLGAWKVEVAKPVLIEDRDAAPRRRR